MRYHSPERVLAALALTLLSVGCQSHGPKSQDARTAATLSAKEAGPKVAAALQRGDYVEAIALTERTALPQPAIDQAVGLLVLDSLVDTAAVTRPAGGLEEGIGRVEAAALAGLPDAATSLRALFHTGLSYQGQNTQLAAHPALEACWQEVEDGKAHAERCVEMRKGSSASSPAIPNSSPR
jgi:hypothetical protein